MADMLGLIEEVGITAIPYRPVSLSTSFGEVELGVLAKRDALAESHHGVDHATAGVK